MGETSTVVNNPNFHRRIATFSHSAIILTVFCLAMIHLESVLKPFFIAMGIYFVLKPGADWLSKNNFPVFLSYLTMLLLFILILISTAFFAWTQASGLIEEVYRNESYIDKLYNSWTKSKRYSMVGFVIKESINEES